MERKTLRGRIIGKYGTLGEFSKAMHWSLRKTSYLVLGKQEPTATDIERMADALDVNLPDELRSLFFN